MENGSKCIYPFENMLIIQFLSICLTNSILFKRKMCLSKRNDIVAVNPTGAIPSSVKSCKIMGNLT